MPLSLIFEDICSQVLIILIIHPHKRVTSVLKAYFKHFLKSFFYLLVTRMLSYMDFTRPKDGWISPELDISNTVCNALQKKGTANLKVLKYGVCLQKCVNMGIHR